MKNILPLLLVVCTSYFCKGQIVSVKFENGTIRSEQMEAKHRHQVKFDLSGITGHCDSSSMIVRYKRNGNPNLIDWSKPGPKEFMMPNHDVRLEFECSGFKGTGTVKLKTDPDPITEVKNDPHREINPEESSVETWGNSLQDAIRLSNWWKTYISSGKANQAVRDSARIILGKYELTGIAFDNIQYLKDYKDLRSDDAQSEFAKDMAGYTNSSATPANPSGIFSPTLVIDALGKFAAKRFKEELTIAFLKKFRDTLMSEEFTELRLLLPRTFHTIATADVFNYAQFYQSLHENAQTDLYNLPENTSTMLRYRQESGKPGKKIRQQLYEPILASLDLVRILELKMSASTAVEFLAYRDYIQQDSHTVYGNIARTLGIFSQRLHSWKDSTATGWADERYLARLVSDKDAFNFWMALVLKQDKDDLTAITIKKSDDPNKTVTMYSLLNGEVYKKQSYLRETLARFSEVQATAKNLVALSKSDSLSKAEMFSRYSVATFGLLIAGVEFAKQADADSDKAGYDRAIHLLKAGQDLAVFAHRKRFGDGISVLLEIVKLVFEVPVVSMEAQKWKMEKPSRELEEAEDVLALAKKAKKKADKTKNEALMNRADAQVAEAEKKWKSLGDGLGKNQKKEQKVEEKLFEVQSSLGPTRTERLLYLIDKYGNLMVSCANAQTSDQLLAILEKAASPVQSYLKKRGEGRLAAAINMYPGLAYGYEIQLEDKGTFSNKGGNIVAFTTPVGLSLDWGIGKKSSLSLFASFIDIGAVTAFRLQDNASRLPELKWKNVFAPGAYLMWGIGGTPLTLGVGGQYGPALRNVQKDVTTPDLQEASHFRAGISLTVDVPLFIVSLRSKN